MQKTTIEKENKILDMLKEKKTYDQIQNNLHIHRRVISRVRKIHAHEIRSEDRNKKEVANSVNLYQILEFAKKSADSFKQSRKKILLSSLIQERIDDILSIKHMKEFIESASENHNIGKQGNKTIVVVGCSGLQFRNLRLVAEDLQLSTHTIYKLYRILHQHHLCKYRNERFEFNFHIESETNFIEIEDSVLYNRDVQEILGLLRDKATVKEVAYILKRKTKEVKEIMRKLEIEGRLLGFYYNDNYYYRFYDN